MTEDTKPTEQIEKQGKSTVYYVGIGLLLLLAILLIVKNSDRLELDLLVTKVSAPLIVLLGIFFGLGFGIAYLLQHQKIRKKNRALKNLGK